MQEIDVAIIGAGTAGITAQRAATKAGARAVMFDPGPLGTTCARVGCMPSKLLISAAEVAHSARVATEFGVRLGAIEIDGEAVMARVQQMRDEFVDSTISGLERVEAKGGLVRQAARLTSANTLTAGGQHYKAGAIVVATGSRPWTPPPYRQLGDRLLSTDQIFELPTLPESLLVVGAGAIGIELALAFARLGVRVTVVELEGKLAGVSDPNVRDSAYTIFSDELDLQTRHEFKSVLAENNQVRFQFVDDAGRARDERYEYVLVATGRRPNLEGLGLESLGLGAADDILASVDSATAQVGTSSLFLAGDVTGTRTLLHEAADEGSIAGENAARYPDEPREVRRPTILGVVFSEPQIATVGLAYDALPGNAAIAEYDFAGQSRAKVLGRAKGCLRVYAAPDGTLLGATVFGPHAEYLGHLLAWLVDSGATASEALAHSYYHPTVVEAIQSVLRKLLRGLKAG